MHYADPLQHILCFVQMGLMVASKKVYGARYDVKVRYENSRRQRDKQKAALSKLACSARWQDRSLCAMLTMDRLCTSACRRQCTSVTSRAEGDK